MRRVGLTGGIATGKSLVADLFARRGVTVLSADALAAEAVEPGGPILSQIAEEFGQRFVRADGGLDRKALADTVFADPAARERLDAIMHPEVLRRLRLRMDALESGDRPPDVVVAEVPLLYEVGIADWFDEVVVVAADAGLQIERLALRNGLSAGEAALRIGAQWPLERKLAECDRVVLNTGSVEETASQVDRILGDWSNT